MQVLFYSLHIRFKPAVESVDRNSNEDTQAFPPARVCVLQGSVEGEERIF
jgi:hypothetical protein